MKNNNKLLHELMTEVQIRCADTTDELKNRCMEFGIGAPEDQRCLGKIEAYSELYIMLKSFMSEETHDA